LNLFYFLFIFYLYITKEKDIKLYKSENSNIKSQIEEKEKLCLTIFQDKKYNTYFIININNNIIIIKILKCTVTISINNN